MNTQKDRITEPVYPVDAADDGMVPVCANCMKEPCQCPATESALAEACQAVIEMSNAMVGRGSYSRMETEAIDKCRAALSLLAERTKAGG